MKLGNVSRGARINRARLAEEKRIKEAMRLDAVGLDAVSRPPYEVTQVSRFDGEVFPDETPTPDEAEALLHPRDEDEGEDDGDCECRRCKP